MSVEGWIKLGVSIRPADMISDTVKVKKCPNCDRLVASDYVDVQTGLTPVRLFWCTCGCSFREVVHPDIPLNTLIAAVPEEVKIQLRDEREEEQLKVKNIYWKMLHSKWV